MTNIRSSLGNVQQNTGEMKTFTVEDRSGADFSIPENAVPLPQDYHPAPGEKVVNPNVAHLYEQQQASRQPPTPEQYVQAPPQPAIKELSVEEWKALRNFGPSSDEELPLSPDARRRIDLLLGIGQVTRSVPVTYGNRRATFFIRTLKSREQKHVLMMLNQFRAQQTNTNLMELRDVTLMYSIYAIDEIELDMILGCPHREPAVRMQYRKQFLNDLDNDLLNYLFDQYNDMITNEVNRFVVTTPEQAKEVVQDLRKSGQAS